MKYLSPIVVIKSLFLLIFGRVRFIKESVEQKVTVNGQDYEIFRRAVLKKTKIRKEFFVSGFTQRCLPKRQSSFHILP